MFILSPIYEFFYYSLRLYEVAEPAALVNGQDERRINAPPLTSAPAPACVVTKRAKATSAFTLEQYVFLISARIVLYRHRKSGYHLGTKAVKILIISIATIFGKACICKAFHSLSHF